MLIKNTNPLKIIEAEAKKEYPKLKFSNNKYVGLQNAIVNQLPKDRVALKELKLEVEEEIKRLEIFNFETFASIRLELYTYTVAVVALIISQTDLVQKFGLNNLSNLILLFILFGIFLVISIRKITDNQKCSLLYLKFKLQCINILYK